MDKITGKILTQLVRELQKTTLSAMQLRTRFPLLLAKLEEIGDVNDETLAQEFQKWLDMKIQQVLQPRLSDWENDLAIRGLALWDEIYIRPLFDDTLPEGSTLHDQWTESRSVEKWERIRRRYGLVNTLGNPYSSSWSTVRWQMHKGCALLADHLNQPAASGTVIEGKDLEQALRRYQETFRATCTGFSANKPLNLATFAVPELRQRQEGQDTSLHPSNLIKAIQVRKPVVLIADTGMGKSTLLHWIGLKLLAEQWLPLSLSNDAVAQIPQAHTEFAKWLTAQLTQECASADGIIGFGLQTRRLVLLIDDGDVWRRADVRQLQRLCAEAGISYVVAARKSIPWETPGSLQLELIWDAHRLWDVMAYQGDVRGWSQLRAWSEAGRLPWRVWDYAFFAQYPLRLTAFDTLTQALHQALDDRAVAYQRSVQWENPEPEEAGRRLQMLRKAAWELTTGDIDTWEPQDRRHTAVPLGLHAGILVATADNHDYRFTATLLRHFLAAEYTVRALTPEAAVTALVGRSDWPEILVWAGELALREGKVTWAEQLMTTLGDRLENTWRRSGWMFATSILAPLASSLSLQEIQCAAENALLQLLDVPAFPVPIRHILHRQLAQAFLALPSLTPDCVAQLWEKVYQASSADPTFYDLHLPLARNPEIARRLLSTPAPLQVHQTGRWLWELARGTEIEISALLAAAERVYLISYPIDLIAAVLGVAGALSIRGDASALHALAEWLQRQAANYDDFPADSELEAALQTGLAQWQGTLEDLWKHAEQFLLSTSPGWIWNGYLHGALQVSTTVGAAHLMGLAERLGVRWRAAQWEVCLNVIAQYGDFQVVGTLAKWWERNGAGVPPRDVIAAVLWGSEGTTGILSRLATEELVSWVQYDALNAALRESLAYYVLRRRGDDAQVTALGRSWVQQGQRSRNANANLLRAGLYLADWAEPASLPALLANESLGKAPLYLAARMGEWALLQPYLERWLDTEHWAAWEIVPLLGQAQRAEWVQRLLDDYLSGQREWLIEAGLLHFDWQILDAGLTQLAPKWRDRMDVEVAQRLWDLGTPEATRLVLRAGYVDRLSAGASPHRAYREVRWSVLADFFMESQDETARWHVLGDLQQLWDATEPRPWGLTAFFFHCLMDRDADVRDQSADFLTRLLQMPNAVLWQGAEWEYAQGLRELVLERTPPQQTLALEWLTVLDSDFAREALNPGELSILLESQVVGLATLHYIAAHKRTEMLEAVSSLAARIDEEAAQLEAHLSPTLPWDSLDTPTQQEITRLEAWREALTTALAQIDVRFTYLLEIAMGKRGFAQGWDAARLEAVMALVQQPEYFDDLRQAVARGDAPEAWLLAAVITQKQVI